MASAATRPPIAAGLVEHHIDRAAHLLPSYDADGLLVFRGSNILGFCGVALEPSDRLVCGLISAEARVAFVVPAFESSLATGLPPESILIEWEEREDPYAALARAARELGIDGGGILLDEHTWIGAKVRLAAAMPRAKLRPDPGLIASIRLVKCAEELDAVRAACVDTGCIYPLVSQRLRVGLSELELCEAVLSRLRSGGCEPFGELIQGGENASIPHRRTGRRLFGNGDAVIVDFVCRREGYLGDMTRTFAVGQPPAEVCAAYRAVREAQRAAIEAIRPGVSCHAVDSVARTRIEKAGLGDCFVHRLGHGIGLDVHEPPYLVQGNSQRLEPGMVVTVEPGVYVPDRFGIRIEDVVAVTEDGCEVLSRGVPTDVCEALGGS